MTSTVIEGHKMSLLCLLRSYGQLLSLFHWETKSLVEYYGKFMRKSVIKGSAHFKKNFSKIFNIKKIQLGTMPKEVH